MDFNSIISGSVGTGVVLFFARYIFNREIKRIDEVENEQQAIKTNYIERFDEIKSILTEMKISIARLEENAKPRKRK